MFKQSEQTKKNIHTKLFCHGDLTPFMSKYLFFKSETTSFGKSTVYQTGEILVRKAITLQEVKYKLC